MPSQPSPVDLNKDYSSAQTLSRHFHDRMGESTAKLREKRRKIHILEMNYFLLVVWDSRVLPLGSWAGLGLSNKSNL